MLLEMIVVLSLLMIAWLLVRIVYEYSHQFFSLPVLLIFLLLLSLYLWLDDVFSWPWLDTK